MTAKTLVERATDTGDYTNLCVVLRGVGTADLQVLLVADEIGRWSIPGGHVKNNETNAEACQREVKEETGLAVEVQPLIWAAHAARKIPSNIFYAVAEGDSELKPGGGDVTKAIWVPLDKLGELNGTDRLVIHVAANRVHNPQQLVDDAVEMAESLGFAVGNVTAPPPPVPGIYLKLFGSAAVDCANHLAEWALNLRWPTTTVTTALCESSQTALERAAGTRRLTPMLESLLLISDALWRYESRIAPGLAKGEIVLEIGPELDMQRLLKRGMPDDLLENLIRRLPLPVATFRVTDQLDLNELQVLKDVVEQMKNPDGPLAEAENPVNCTNCGHTFNSAKVPEAGMGYVKCPVCNAPVVEQPIDPDDPEVNINYLAGGEYTCPHCCRVYDDGLQRCGADDCPGTQPNQMESIESNDQKFDADEPKSNIKRYTPDITSMMEIFDIDIMADDIGYAYVFRHRENEAPVIFFTAPQRGVAGIDDCENWIRQRWEQQGELNAEEASELTDDSSARSNQTESVDDPEAFVRNFVDKNLGTTFLIHRSGDNSVYADKPFRHDYIVYSNDDPNETTRTFEGYLRKQGEQWLAYTKEAGYPDEAYDADGNYIEPEDRPVHPDEPNVAAIGQFDTPEAGAYELYRLNRCSGS